MSGTGHLDINPADRARLLASATAEAALTMPAPQDFWSHVDKGVAVFCRMVTISVVFRSGLADSISAMVPETWGAA